MNLTNPVKSSENRVLGLDLFRAIAILLVVFGHGAFLLKNTPLEGFPYIKMIDGVDLFFVLSGFLIGRILIKEINIASGFGFRSLINFWKRRWMRTLPNYYLILAANYFVISNKIIIEDIQQFSWKFIFFLQNFNKPFYGFFWESWSLAVEEWFYLLTPLILIFFLKLFNSKQSFLITTILMIILPIIYRISIYNPSIDDFSFDIGLRKIVLTRLDSIAFGLLAAWIFVYLNKYWNKFKWAALVTGILLIVFLINTSYPNNTFYKQVFYFSLSPISAMLLLPFANSINLKNGVFSIAITHISKISYSMYLIHLALVAEVIRDNIPVNNEMQSFINYGIYWIVVIIASSLLYKYFEKPIMKLRDR